MKVGDLVAFRTDLSITGTIVDIEQYGNTPAYFVKWDDSCPLTGRRGKTSVLSSELIVVKNESR